MPSQQTEKACRACGMSFDAPRIVPNDAVPGTSKVAMVLWCLAFDKRITSGAERGCPLRTPRR